MPTISSTCGPGNQQPNAIPVGRAPGDTANTVHNATAGTAARASCDGDATDQLRAQLQRTAEQLLLWERGARPQLEAAEVEAAAELLDSIADCLEASNPAVPTPEASSALALLSDPGSRDALLSIAAVAVRRAIPGSGDGEGEEPAGGSSGGAGGGSGRTSEGGGGSRDGGSSAQLRTNADSGDSAEAPTESTADGTGLQREQRWWSAESAADPVQRGSRVATPLYAESPSHGAWEGLWRATGTAMSKILMVMQPQGAPPSPQALEFAHRLLRTQVLHCCSRRLAVVNTRVRRCLHAASAVSPSPSAATELNAQHCGGAASAAAAAPAASAPSNAMRDLHKAIAMAQGLLAHVIELFDQRLLDGNDGPHRGAGGQQQQEEQQRLARAHVIAFASELRAALRGSFLLEHVAHGLLLAALLAARAEPAVPDGTADDELPVESARAFGAELVIVLDSFFDARLGLQAAYGRIAQLQPQPVQQSSGSAPPPVSEATWPGPLLGEGRCVLHLALSMALAALHAAVGGPTHGMPPELLRGMPLLGWSSGNDEELCDLRECSSGSGLQVLYSGVLHLAAGVLSRTHYRAAAPSILLRIGRLVITSARSWARLGAGVIGSGGGSAAPPVQPPSGSPPLDQALPQPGPPQPQPPVQLVLPKSNIAEVALSALWALDAIPLEQLGPAAAVARWRLAIDAALFAPECSDTQELIILGGMLRPRMLGPAEEVFSSDGSAPPPPPPDLALAVEAGLLPFLERLVRRAAEAPAGRDSALLAGVLAGCQGRSLLCWLLLHGDPSAAAALVVSVGKAFRRLAAQLFTELRELLEAWRKEAAEEASCAAGALPNGEAAEGCAKPLEQLAASLLAIVVAAAGVLRCGPGWLAAVTIHHGSVGAGSGSGGSTGADDGGATPESTVQRARRLVSLAAAEWLPPLSHFVQGAAVLQQSLQAKGIDAGARGELSSLFHCATTAIMPPMCWLGLLPPPPPPSEGEPSEQQQSSQQHAKRQQRTRRGRGGGSRPSGADAVAASGAITPAPAVPPATYRALRRLLVEEAGAVPLVGAALRLLVPGNAWLRLGLGRDLDAALLHLATDAACVMGACQPELCAAAAASPAAVAPPGPAAASATSPSAAGGSMSVIAAADTGAETASLSFWPPELLGSLAADMRRLGLGNQESILLTLANLLGMWRAGSRDMLLLQFPPDHKAAAAQAAFVPPPHSRGALRACAHPACTNVAGDSEADVSLKACSLCGAVGYCCRECQAAHWRAGHRAECAGRRGAG